MLILVSVDRVIGQSVISRNSSSSSILYLTSMNRRRVFCSLVRLRYIARCFGRLAPLVSTLCLEDVRQPYTILLTPTARTIPVAAFTNNAVKGAETFSLFKVLVPRSPAMVRESRTLISTCARSVCGRVAPREDAPGWRILPHCAREGAGMEAGVIGKPSRAWIVIADMRKTWRAQEVAAIMYLHRTCLSAYLHTTDVKAPFRVLF